MIKEEFINKIEEEFDKLWLLTSPLVTPNELTGLNIRNTKDPLAGEIFFVEDLTLIQKEKK